MGGSDALAAGEGYVRGHESIQQTGLPSPGLRARLSRKREWVIRSQNIAKPILKSRTFSLRRVVSHPNAIPAQPLLPPPAAAGAGTGNEMDGVLGSLTRAKAQALCGVRRYVA